MTVKIYEAQTLISTMEQRAKHYTQLKTELEQLKKEFEKISDFGDELKGKGADAIKAFYKAQADVVDEWLQLIVISDEFYKGISGTTEDLNLSGSTIIQVPFLEMELAHSTRTARDIVSAQHEDLQQIFDEISDIISLQTFSTEQFEDHIEKADKERKETIKKVNELDQNLLQEYKFVEAQAGIVISLFQALLDASSQGGEVSPLYFNAQAYNSSEIHQVKEEFGKEAKAYLDFKKEQAEVRKQIKEQIERENRPWYEKAWDAICIFTGEITGYYDTIRAAEGVDPITGEKLSTAERVTAGAMAGAGFIPIVGWAGRIFKGGKAIYKTAKGVKAATYSLDAYKATKSFDLLQKTEMGIYGFVTANGFSEYLTGRDMFGNELSEEKRQRSLTESLFGLGLGGAAYTFDRVFSSNYIGKNFPFSKEYVNNKLKEVQKELKSLGQKVGQIRVPIVRAKVLSTNAGRIYNVFPDSKTLNEVKENLMMKFSGTEGSRKTGIVGTVQKDGNKTNYTNPAGNELSWVDQHSKNIDRDIDNALKSSNVGKATEAKVADFIRKETQVIGFGLKILKKDGQVAGDLDVVTRNTIIEVKASIKAVREDQFNKMTQTNADFFFNPDKKKVILYIDKPLINLRPEHKTMLENIKSKGVTIVNSLEELKEALD